MMKAGGPLARMSAALGQRFFARHSWYRRLHGFALDAGRQKTMGISPCDLRRAIGRILDNLPAWLASCIRMAARNTRRWVIATCALVMAAGTAASLAHHQDAGPPMVKCRPSTVAAETASATILGQRGALRHAGL